MDLENIIFSEVSHKQILSDIISRWNLKIESTYKIKRLHGKEAHGSQREREAGEG